MTIDEVYRLMQYIVNKNQNGYLAPEEFNLIIEQAQTSFLNYLLGAFQQYAPRRPQSRVDYSQNETTRQRLQPFIKETVLDIDTDGHSPYPTDYEQVDAMWSQYGFYRIKFIQQDSQFSVLRSVIDPVTQNPVFLLKRDNFQFYPTDLQRARMSYVSTPNQLNWAYINSIYGLPIWDQGNSSNPEWYEVDLMEVIVRALRMVGVNLQQQDVANYANQIKTEGQ